MKFITEFNTKARKRIDGRMELSVPKASRELLLKDSPIKILIFQEDDKLISVEFSDDFLLKQKEAIQVLTEKGEFSQYGLAYILKLDLTSINKLMNRIRLLEGNIDMQIRNDVKYYSIKD